MKQLQKLIFVLLALCLMISFTACNGSTGETSTSKSSTQSKSTKSDASDSEDDESGADESELTSDIDGNSSKKTSNKTNSKKSSSKSSSKKSSSKSTSSIAPSKIANPLGYDMKGRTISIVSASAGNPFPTGQADNSIQKALVARTEKLQSELNCKIDVRITTGDDISAEIYSKVLSGEKYADLLYMPIYQTVGYIAGQVAVAFDGINTIDLEAAYMNPANMFKSTAIKGKHFICATEDMFANVPMGMFFNKRILKEVFGDKDEYNPYKLVAKNQWTISKMEAMSKDATKKLTGSGAMTKDDQWGLLAKDKLAASTDAYFFASGGTMISNANNKLTYSLEDPKNYKIIDTIKSFYTDSKTVYTTDYNVLADLFATGHGLFYSASVFDVSNLGSMKDDFGFVPWPRGDSVNNFKGAVNWNTSVFMIPAGPQDKKDAGALLQAAGYLSGSVSDAKFQELDDRYFRDDESIQMVKTAVKAMELQVSNIVGGNYWAIHEGTYTCFYTCIPGTTATKTYIEQFASPTKKALTEFLSLVK